MAFFLVVPQITDISGLQARLDFWEWFDRIALVVVFLGVLGELLAEFTNVFKTQDDEKRKKHFTVAFSLVLLVGLAGEFMAVLRTTRLSNEITAILRSDIATAFQRASEALTKQQGVETELAKQQQRAADAEQRAADAQLKAASASNSAGEANKKAEELRAQNLATELKLEEERKTRMELERSLAPRVLSYIEKNGKTNLDALRRYAGVPVILEYVPDAEAERAAVSVENIIALAGWKIVKTAARPDRNIPIFDGVTIEFKFIPGVFSPAAEELQDFLLDNGWQANATWTTDDIPPNTLRIVVGFKPSPRL